MEQVSGRAGRKDDKGKVLIQVTNTAHPVLAYVQQHNYKAMYDAEIEARKNFFYPPFSRLIHLSIRHRDNHIAEEAAHLLVNGLKINFEKYITGPAQPPVPRIRNKYFWDVLFKLPKNTNIINACKHGISQQVAILAFNKRYRAVDIIADVDPV